VTNISRVATGADGTRRLARLSLGALGIAMAFIAAPAALADESDVPPAWEPAASVIAQPDVSEPTVPSVSAAAPVVAAAAVPAGAVSSPAQAADPGVAPPLVPAPVSHLSSPQNLPPGTTDTAPQQPTRLNYLRDVLQAIRSQDVTMSDALLLLAQRPLDAKPTAGTSPAAAPSVPGSAAAVSNAAAPAAVSNAAAPAAGEAPAGGADTP
jgi:hypothetical protein